MEVKRAETIEYRPSVMADSEYKLTRLVQNTGGDSVVISGTQAIATIELPAVAMNLAKSWLNFTITVPKNGTGAGAALIYRDTPPIQRLELFTRSGRYLCDVSNFANIYQAFGQRTKKIESFHGFRDGIVTNVKTTPSEMKIRRFDTMLGSDAGTHLSSKFRIPGRELYNTILSLDKSVYFGEVLQLRLTFGSLDSIAFHATNDTGAGGTPAPSATLTDFNYYLAQEQNPRVVTDLIQTVSTEGMSLVVPFVHSYKTTGNSENTAVSIRLSRGHGQSVERVYTIPISGAETFADRYVADAEQLVSFYSLLDSRRIQEFDIKCGGVGGAKDYIWLREHAHQDRVVSLDAANDVQNFAWSDSWCEELECAKNQRLGGLDLSVERKYDVYFEAAATVVDTKYYSAVVCQKMLTISPVGIEIM